MSDTHSDNGLGCLELLFGFFLMWVFTVFTFFTTVFIAYLFYVTVILKSPELVNAPLLAEIILSYIVSQEVKQLIDRMYKRNSDNLQKMGHKLT